MPGVAQRRTKLSGQWYDRGAEVPDDLVNDRLVSMGIVTRSSGSGSGGSAVVELERTKRELAEAQSALESAGVLTPGPAFDPDEHTAAEVVAHVDTHPEDTERVRAVEAAGLGRKSLLAVLDRRLAAGEAEQSHPEAEDGQSADRDPTAHQEG